MLKVLKSERINVPFFIKERRKKWGLSSGLASLSGTIVLKPCCQSVSIPHNRTIHITNLWAKLTVMAPVSLMLLASPSTVLTKTLTRKTLKLGKPLRSVSNGGLMRCAASYCPICYKASKVRPSTTLSPMLIIWRCARWSMTGLCHINRWRGNGFIHIWRLFRRTNQRM